MNCCAEKLTTGEMEKSSITLRRPWRAPLRIAASVALATLVGLALWCIALITFFRARRFYREVIAARLGRAILRIWGIQLDLRMDRPLPASQVIYISNHTSTLDVIILLALGLPNTRFFMFGGTRKWPPVLLLGHAMGIFFTPPQTNRWERVQCFRHAARVLKSTRESVYLSPEGVRVTTGEIGPFNKGAFHLATDLKAPIVPLYIAIPQRINPGLGLAPLPGTVRVYRLPPILTSEWTLDQLEMNKERVHQFYLALHRALRSHGQ